MTGGGSPLEVNVTGLPSSGLAGSATTRVVCPQCHPSKQTRMEGLLTFNRFCVVVGSGGGPRSPQPNPTQHNKHQCRQRVPPLASRVIHTIAIACLTWSCVGRASPDADSSSQESTADNATGGPSGQWGLLASASGREPKRAAVRSTLHTRAYYQTVNEALVGATSQQEALGVLSSLNQRLLSGGP